MNSEYARDAMTACGESWTLLCAIQKLMAMESLDSIDFREAVAEVTGRSILREPAASSAVVRMLLWESEEHMDLRAALETWAGGPKCGTNTAK